MLTFYEIFSTGPKFVILTARSTLPKPKQGAQNAAVHTAVSRLQAVRLTVSLKKKKKSCVSSRESVCVCQSRDGSSESAAGWEGCEMNQQHGDR